MPKKTLSTTYLMYASSLDFNKMKSNAQLFSNNQWVSSFNGLDVVVDSANGSYLYLGKILTAAPSGSLTFSIASSDFAKIMKQVHAALPFKQIGAKSFPQLYLFQV